MLSKIRFLAEKRQDVNETIIFKAIFKKKPVCSLLLFRLLLLFFLKLFPERKNRKSLTRKSFKKNSSFSRNSSRNKKKEEIKKE